MAVIKPIKKGSGVIRIHDDYCKDNTPEDNQKIVDECTACFPQNEYEQTKYAAEQILLRQIPAKRLIILRPTNVFGENHPKNHLLNLFWNFFQLKSSSKIFFSVRALNRRICVLFFNNI